MTSSPSPTLATTRTGGLSLGQILIIVAAAALIAIQVFMIAFPTPEAPGQRYGFGGQRARGFSGRDLTGITAPLIIIGVILFLGRKGESSLTRRSISGKSIGGKVYTHELAALAAPDLNLSALSLRDAATQKLILNDRSPDNPHFLGTWWLLATYPDLPNAVWEAFAADTAAPREGAVRSFLDYEGRTTFLDAGCVIELSGAHCFFPTTATQPFIQSNPGGALLSTNIQSKPMQLRFEPNPARLPMERFLRALARTPLDAAHADLLDTLLDTHGGCRLTRTAQGWSGECAGYPVEVVEAAQ